MQMGRLIKKMDACDLPLVFWDKVIFYDYFISHSGMIEIEPHITMWTSDGEQYCLNTNELRDRRLERAIPFFEPMANKDKIAKGDSFYFDWELVPNAWKHYYHQSNHCFMPDAVYDEFMRNMKRVENADKAKTAGRQASIEDKLKYLSIWKTLLKQSYKEVLGTTICEDVMTYIRLDEKIHVYNEPYAGKHLSIDRISDDVIADLKNAAAWSIHYTAIYEGLWMLIRIVVYFEKSEPFYMEYEFEGKICLTILMSRNLWKNSWLSCNAILAAKKMGILLKMHQRALRRFKEMSIVMSSGSEMICIR